MEDDSSDWMVGPANVVEEGSRTGLLIGELLVVAGASGRGLAVSAMASECSVESFGRARIRSTVRSKKVA